MQAVLGELDQGSAQGKPLSSGEDCAALRPRDRLRTPAEGIWECRKKDQTLEKDNRLFFCPELAFEWMG